MKVLWLGMNSALIPSFSLESSLAQGLALMGDEVTRIRCDGIFHQLCPAMINANLDVSSSRASKEKICAQCKAVGKSADTHAAYNSLPVERFITNTDHSAVQEIIEGVNQANWRDLMFDVVPVGRYASYLTMLHYKVQDVTQTSSAWQEYISDLRDSLLMLRVLPRVFDLVEPTHAMVYNPLYPTNRMFTEIAQRRHVQLIALSTGAYVPDREGTVAIYPHISASQTLVDSATIRSSLATPCSTMEVDAVVRHFHGLIAGQDPWVYSSAPTRASTEAIRASLGIGKPSPVILALVASPDETRSSALVDAEFERAPGLKLSDVSEFVREAVDLGRRNPDIEIVIRLHPRLAPNKRELIRSPDLEELLTLLDSRPENVHVNAPGDGIGLYDVMRIADIGFNQSSSSGLELLTLGIPVIHYDPVRMNAYPPSFGWEVDRGNPAALDRAVHEALKSLSSNALAHERSVMAFRWYTTALLRSLVHKSTFPLAETQPTLSVSNGPTRAKPMSAFRLRRIVPRRIRERIAWWMSERASRQVVRPASEVAPWVIECRDRIQGLGSGPIWNPLVVPRGDAQTDDHPSIIAAVDRLKKDLAWTTS